MEWAVLIQCPPFSPVPVGQDYEGINMATHALLKTRHGRSVAQPKDEITITFNVFHR